MRPHSQLHLLHDSCVYYECCPEPWLPGCRVGAGLRCRVAGLECQVAGLPGCWVAGWCRVVPGGCQAVRTCRRGGAKRERMNHRVARVLGARTAPSTGGCQRGND